VNESAVDNLERGSGACLVVNVHPPRSFEVFKSLAKLHVPVPSTAILGTRAPPSDLGATAFNWRRCHVQWRVAMTNDLAVGVTRFTRKFRDFLCLLRPERPTNHKIQGGLGAAAAVKHHTTSGPPSTRATLYRYGRRCGRHNLLFDTGRAAGAVQHNAHALGTPNPFVSGQSDSSPQSRAAIPGEMG
jgi:hypothetical protein